MEQSLASRLGAIVTIGAFWLALFGVLLLLEHAVSSGLLSAALFPTPSELAKRIVTILWTDTFYLDIGSTLGRALLSTMLGFPVGVLLAYGLLFLGPARGSALATLDFVRSVPLTALIPILITIFGVGDAHKVAIGACAATLTTYLTIWLAIKQSLISYGLMLRLYRPPLVFTIRHILIPSTKSAMVTAVRLSASLALILVIVSEMFVGTDSGIGKVINDKAYTDDRAGQYAAVIYAGLVGVMFNIFLKARDS